MKRVAKWILMNGLMAGFLWAGIVDGVDGAYRVGMFMLWLTIVLSFLACIAVFSKQGKAELTWRRPRWFIAADVLFDLGILSFLVWHGFIVTGAFYLVHMICLHAIREKAKEAA